jgi:hypothetical protein
MGEGPRAMTRGAAEMLARQTHIHARLRLHAVAGH